MAPAADPRTDVSRCSSCRRWAGSAVGAGKCRQRVRSLDPQALMMLQLSHTPHSAECCTLLSCVPQSSRHCFHAVHASSSTPLLLLNVGLLCSCVLTIAQKRRMKHRSQTELIPDVASADPLAGALSPSPRPSWEPVGPLVATQTHTPRVKTLLMAECNTQTDGNLMLESVSPSIAGARCTQTPSAPRK